MEVAPGIHRIEAPLGNRIVCSFLFVGEDAALLMDTGIAETPRGTIAPYLAEHGIALDRIRYVVTSHADLDHSGGNEAMRALAPSALFLCHELDRVMIEDAEALQTLRYSEFAAEHGIDDSDDAKAWTRANTKPCKIDLTLTGGERIRLGPDWWIDVLHTAGHTYGHITLYDARSKTAAIADAALWYTVAARDGSPAFPPTYRYLETYLNTIQRLQGMPIDTLLTGHYPLQRGPQVAEFLAESRTYTERVDQALIALLQAAPQPMTLREIIAALKTTLGNWPEGAEIFLDFPLSGHLDRLVSYQRVVRGRRDNLTTFAWLK